MHTSASLSLTGVHAWQEVQSKRSISVHSATFYQTDEAVDQPPRELARAAAAQGLAEGEFVTRQHGVLIKPGSKMLPNDLPVLGIGASPASHSKITEPSRV